MAEIEKYGSVKRFGARYGRKLKERFGKIEMEQRKKQKCPYCSAFKVKRIAVGIWECRKCNAKFTGKAYSVSKKVTFKEEPEEKSSVIEEDPKKEAKEEVKEVV
jgi:large subunit ribosomal protein L37Ae